MSDKRPSERLWLSREPGAEAYVDAAGLPPHQLDGIRFLYNQFKKKKPGVILNDPAGYGKTAMVCVFLNAVRRQLSAPALVLCRAAETQHWRDQLHRWTDFGDDVAFDSTNAFLKKSLFVCGGGAGAAAACRRSWAVAVVDDDTVTARPNANYKIWITNNDMKENLFAFSSIYQWMYPKEEINIKDFTANKCHPKDVVAKALMLDAFQEEIVLRRRGVTPFRKPETLTPATPAPRITRKNKDATGTKIKRSKVRIEPETNAKIPKLDTPRNATITSKDYVFDNKDKADMDVESFIRNEKPIESDGVEEYMDFQTMMTNQSDSNSAVDYREAVHDIARHGKETSKVNGSNIPSIAVTEVAANKESDDYQFAKIDSEVSSADFRNAIDDIVNNENHDDTSKDVSNDKVPDAIKNDESDAAARGGDVESKNGDEVKEIKDDKLNGKIKDLDTKLTELEEKTMSKFKGSLLDSIF